MSWIDKILPATIRTEAGKADKKGVPEGVWEKCPNCQSVIYLPELLKNLSVCPHCTYHLRIRAKQRMDYFFDEGSQVELFESLAPVDMLKFKDTKAYKDRIADAQKKAQTKDALLVAKGTVCDVPLVAAAFDFGFLGGSMGSVVGEKFTRAVHYAMEHQLPLVCFTASGGARMQESLYSLMQMAKVSAALAHLQQKRCPYVVVLTDPTTGGVSASLAMLGDIHIAEPKALIGFAGPRVIEQTVREKLPEGFQRSEFLQEKGMVDMIVDRRELNKRLSDLLLKMQHYTLPKDPEDYDEASSS